MESSNRLWAIVLAGGQGVRLRRLARGVCGEERPKQYVPLLGARTLLRQTLDRVWLAVAPERTIVVTVWDHARYLAAEDASAWGADLLVQPDSRGTAYSAAEKESPTALALPGRPEGNGAAPPHLAPWLHKPEAR